MDASLNLWELISALVERSIYQPYKTLYTPERLAIRYVQVWDGEVATAACPAYGLIAQGDSVLTVWETLAPQLKTALGLPAATVFSVTCSAPFPLDQGCAAVSEPGCVESKHDRRTERASEALDSVESDVQGQLSFF